MTVDPYFAVWSALSVTARAELTSLAAEGEAGPLSNELRAELLARLPDVIEWRAWRPGPSNGHQVRVDERLLDWIRSRVQDAASSRNYPETSFSDATRVEVAHHPDGTL
jgi:hypothetical protein